MIVVGSSARAKNERVYHRFDCIYVKRIKKKNLLSMYLHEAENNHYCACTYCSGLQGELRVKKARLLEWETKYCLKTNYDKNTETLYIRSKVGFWKVFLKPGMNEYRLYHLNEYKDDMSFEQMKRGSFHRQSDIKVYEGIDNYIKYIADHDRAKMIIMDDYRKLPKATKRQKKYYKQAERRERRNSLKRVASLFEMIEKENHKIRV